MGTRSITFMLAGFTLVTAIPASAQTIYTNRAAFLAATTGHTITTFEENGPGGTTPHATFFGVNFSIYGSSTIYTVDPAAAGGFYDFGTGDVLDVEFANTTITVDPSVRAFGFDYAPLRLVGGDYATINGVNYTNAAGRTLNFFGIVGTSAIGPVTIGWNGGPNIIDNFTIAAAPASAAVPEPATWAMMILGFGGVGGSLRYRRRADRVVSTRAAGTSRSG